MNIRNDDKKQGLKIFGPLRPDPSSLFNRASARTVALVNAIVLAGSANAQTADSAKVTASGTTRKHSTTDIQTEEVVLSEVVVAAKPDAYKAEFLESPKYTAPILDTPQTINVVPEQVIKDQNATSLRDVLRNVPGITVQAGEGGVPNGDIFTIRGFTARTDMFVDGIRDIGGYTRDPFNYEQVEVAKGPSGAYAGRGSTGGSVNMVTKRPNLEARYAGSVGVGTDQYFRSTLDINQPIANSPIPGTSLRLNAVWHENDVAGRDFIYNKRLGIAPSVAFGLGTDTRVFLSYFHLEQENRPDYGIPWVPLANEVWGEKYGNQPPPGIDYRKWYGVVGRDLEKTRTDIITLEAERDINENFTLRNVFRYGRNERDSISTAPRFNSTKSTEIKREFKSHMRVTEIIADTISARAKFDTWKFSHTVDFGFEFATERETNRGRNTLDGTSGPVVADIFNPDAQDKPTPYPVGSDNKLWTGPFTGAATHIYTDSYGLFFFDTVKLDEKLELSGGVRWDRFETDYQNVPIRGTITSGTKVKTTYFSRTDEAVTWRIGPVFKPVPYGSIYVAYGTSFNPSSEGMSLAANNVNVDPERAQTFEIGTKWDLFNNRLSLQGSIFRIEKTNARTPSLDPDEPSLVLQGNQRVDGIELGAQGSITDKWKVYAGVTYLNSRIIKSNTPEEVGRRLPNTPQTTFNFWTTYELPWNITVGGGGQYVGSRFTDAANTRKAPDYWLFDAMVSYKINQNLTAQFNIQNIADEKYIDRTHGGHFVPGVGRTATLTLYFEF